MFRTLLLALVLTVATLAGCAEEKVYDWQRPHDTYQVGAFSKAQNAEALKAKLKSNGFDSRIETEIKNGEFFLNVLVDVYDQSPDTVRRLEQISGVRPTLRNRTATSPKTAIPPSGI